jgi:four helix bundle protein
MTFPVRFPHQRLDAYRLALDARRATWKLVSNLPAPFGDDRRQLRRSSQAVPKLIAEGADRMSSGVKRQRFDEALGEIGETAAGLEDLVHLGVLGLEDVEPVHALWGRTRGAVLGLVKRK